MSNEKTSSISKIIASVESVLADIGIIPKRSNLNESQLMAALEKMKNEFFRLKGVEVEVAPLRELKTKVEPTTKAERFSDALTILCGGYVPEIELVDAWFDEEDDQSHIKLQEWAVNHSAAGWAMGIGVIDAALTLADNPDEGVDHKF